MPRGKCERLHIKSTIKENHREQTKSKPVRIERWKITSTCKKDVIDYIHKKLEVEEIPQDKNKMYKKQIYSGYLVFMSIVLL